VAEGAPSTPCFLTTASPSALSVINPAMAHLTSPAPDRTCLGLAAGGGAGGYAWLQLPCTRGANSPRSETPSLAQAR
jgi:hypothetical protein